MATSTLQAGDVVRERAAGQGARLLRGEEHKDFDAGVRLQKEVKKNDVKAQKEQAVKDTADRAVAESRVMLCRNCARPFEREKCLRKHEQVCHEQLASFERKRKTAVLRPAAALAQDQVHSAASLSIGQGNVFRGDVFPQDYQILSSTTRCACCQGRMGVQRRGWGERWGLQEVPKGFSAVTVQQQRGAKN
jgi:hypothetical protein